MKQGSSPNYIYISNWKKDRFILEYDPHSHGIWEVLLLGANEV